MSIFNCRQSAKFLANCSITTRAAVFPRETSVICSVVRLIIDTVLLKAIDIEVFLCDERYRGVVRVPCVDFPFWFLATSFSMIEIPCWNVSMTSTNSASDLLKSFASLIFAVFGLFSALTRAPGS